MEGKACPEQTTGCPRDATPSWWVQTEEKLQTVVENEGLDRLDVEQHVYRMHRNIRQALRWVERGDGHTNQDTVGTSATETNTKPDVENRAVQASKLLQKMAQKIMHCTKVDETQKERRQRIARGIMGLLEPICWCLTELHCHLPLHVKTALAGVSGAEKGIAGVVVEQWLYEDWEWELFFEKLEVCLRMGLSPIQAQAAAMKLRNQLETVSNQDMDQLCRYASQYGAVLVTLCQSCQNMEFASREILCHFFLTLVSPTSFTTCMGLLTFILSCGPVSVSAFSAEVEQICAGCEHEEFKHRRKKILLVLLALLMESKLSMIKNFAMCDILQRQEVCLYKEIFEEIAAADVEFLRELLFTLQVCANEYRRFGLLPAVQCVSEATCGSRHDVGVFLSILALPAVSDDGIAFVSQNLAGYLLGFKGTFAGQMAYKQCALVAFQLAKKKKIYLIEPLIDPCKTYTSAASTLVNLCMFHIGTGSKASAFAVVLLCKLLKEGIGNINGLGTTITELFIPALQQDAETRRITYQNVSALLQGKALMDQVTYTSIEDVLMQHLSSYCCLDDPEFKSGMLCTSLCFRLQNQQLTVIEPLPEFLQYLLRTVKKGSKKRNRLARKALSILHELSNPFLLGKALGIRKGNKAPHPESWLPAAYVLLPLLETLLNELALHSSSEAFPIQPIMEILSMHMVLSGKSSAAYKKLPPESNVLQLNPVEKLSRYLSLEASIRILQECILAAKTAQDRTDGDATSLVPPNLLAYTVALAAGKVKADMSAINMHLLRDIAIQAVQLYLLYSRDLHKTVPTEKSGQRNINFSWKCQNQDYEAARHLASVLKELSSGQTSNFKKAKFDDGRLSRSWNQNGDDIFGGSSKDATSRLRVASLRLYSYVCHRFLEHHPDTLEAVVAIAMEADVRKTAAKAAVKYAQPSAGRGIWSSAMQIASSCPLEGTRLYFTLSLQSTVVELAIESMPDREILAMELCSIVELLTPLAEREVAQLSLTFTDRKTPLASKVPVVLLKMMWECPVSSPDLLKSLLRGLLRSGEQSSATQAVHQEAAGAVAKFALNSLYSCFGTARGKALQIPDSYECGAVALSEILSFLNQMLSSLQTQEEMLSETWNAQLRKFVQVCVPFRWICLVAAGVETPLPGDLVKAMICFKESSNKFLHLLLVSVKWVTRVQDQLLSLVVNGKAHSSSPLTLSIESNGVENPPAGQKWKPLVTAVSACERLVSAIRVMVDSHEFSTWPTHRSLPELLYEVERFCLNRAKLFAWSEDCGRLDLAENKQMQLDGKDTEHSGLGMARAPHPSHVLAEMLYNAMLEAEQADLQEFEVVDAGKMESDGNVSSQQRGEHSGKRRTKKMVVKSKGKMRPTRKKRKRSLNPYIDAVMAVPEYGSEDGDDNYSDLEDFIVCKPGKDYRKVMYKYSTAQDLSD